MAKQSSENVAQTAFMCQFCDQQNVKWKCVDCGIFLCSLSKEKIHTRLKSSDKHRILSIKDVGKMQCYDNEPWFHGKMTRVEGVKLLQKYKYMGNGTFLVRESETETGNYSLDVLVNGELIHSRIFTKRESGQLKYSSGGRVFHDSLKDYIEFLKRTPGMPKCEGVPFTSTAPVPNKTTK